MSCYCDYEPNEFLNVQMRKARKQHKCEECHDVIDVGETYEYVSGNSDGRLWTAKTCEHCAIQRKELLAQTGRTCFYYGDLQEMLRESYR